MSNDNKKSFVPGDLPAQEAFKQKEIYQHPQPGDSGKPLNKDEKKVDNVSNNDKEQERTSKEQGLNEEHAAGNAGAFEGFEDQQSDA